MRTFPKLSEGKNSYGYYEIRWSEFVDGDWRSMRRSTKTDDRTKAEAALARILTLRDHNAENVREYEEVCQIYMRQHSRPKGTEVSDARNLRASIGAFGSWPATLIKHSDVDAYARARARGKYGPKAVAPSTIRREITAMQAVLNWASRKQIIPDRQVYRFDKPSENYEPRDKWMMEDQEKDLLTKIKSAEPSVRMFTYLGLTYGVRKGAMLELRWDQVNFISNTIDFNVSGKARVRKRRPVVAMTRTVRAELEAMFKDRTGPRVLDSNTAYQFRKAVTEYGYEWVTPHVLKHTAITLMLRQGMRPEDVAKLTATDIRTILRTYRHHHMSELLDLAERRGI